MKKAIDAGLTIKRQTVEEWLANPNNKITIVPENFNYAQHEEMQKQVWYHKMIRGRQTRLDRKLDVEIIDETLGNE